MYTYFPLLPFCSSSVEKAASNTKCYTDIHVQVYTYKLEKIMNKSTIMPLNRVTVVLLPTQISQVNPAEGFIEGIKHQLHAKTKANAGTQVTEDRKN